MWQIFLPPVGWLCWTLGGWDWVIKGKQRLKHGKVFRRYLWPLVAGWALSSEGMGLFMGAVVTSLMALILSLGYGDNSKLRRKIGKWKTFIFLGLLYSASVSFQGLSVWHLLVFLWTPIGIALSMGKTQLRHKIWEGFIGLLQGVCLL